MKLVRDFNRRDLTAIDIGDSAYTSTGILNVCFVPDITSEYYVQTIDLSQALNGDNSSDYVLAEEPSINSTVASHPHITVTHIAIDNIKQNWRKVADKLTKLVGTELTLQVKGRLYFQGKPFDRLDKATKGAFARLPADTLDSVVWADVDRTAAFENAQEQVHRAILKAGNVTCLSGKGDGSFPHHTMYVKRILPSNKMPTGLTMPITSFKEPTTVEISHMLAIGDCGPWGQVRRFTVGSERVHEFIRSTLG